MDIGFVHQVRIKRNGGEAIGSNRTKVVLFVVQCDQIWRQWETLHIPDRGPRDLSISIRCETTLPKRLHSRAVTCELNDHRIKFASTATATGSGWEGVGRGGRDDNSYSPDFKTGNLCVRKDNWIWKSRHPTPRLNAFMLFQ